MPANELTALADRVEALEGPDRAVFAEAFELVQPGIDAPDWLASAARFYRLIDAEAWTSAAEMLVPEGWHPRRLVWMPDCIEMSMSNGFATATGRAKHRALAELAASLHARAGRV